MKLRSILAVMWLSLMAFPIISLSQSGSIDLPSISAASGHIFIANRTNAEVVFYLQSANTDRTEHHLAANSAATFSGAPGDSWFNIDVYSNKAHVSYGLDAGARHYLEWNSAGILDVYKFPPQ